MRGTLHLIAAEDYGWLVPLTTEPSLANAHRRLKQEGVHGDQPAKAVRLIAKMLEREGPLTRAAIADRLQQKGIQTAGQAIAHLVWLAAAQESSVTGQINPSSWLRIGCANRNHASVAQRWRSLRSDT